MNDRLWAMGLQCYLSSMALYSRRLPPGYQIVLHFIGGNYSTALLDPDGVQTASEPPQGFAELCEIAQEDAARRATDGVL